MELQWRHLPTHLPSEKRKAVQFILISTCYDEPKMPGLSFARPEKEQNKTKKNSQCAKKEACEAGNSKVIERQSLRTSCAIVVCTDETIIKAKNEVAKTLQLMTKHL